jgi:predicted dehydrogenase
VTDYRELVRDPSVDVVFVATRHDLHFDVAAAAVEAGKAVFVEKPMTLTTAQGQTLAELVEREGALLTVGFNRRFSPHVVRLVELLRPIGGPKTLCYRVNAGPLPPDHWLFDPQEGGGRLLGEGVHFFDLLCFLAGAEPTAVSSASPEGGRNEAVVTLEFADSSVGVLTYTGSGAPAAGKERLEVFAGGATFVIDDFRSLQVFGLDKKGSKTRTVEKGQSAQLANLYRALRGERPIGVTVADGLRATWCAERALAAGQG